MAGIWVFSESRDLCLELLGAGVELAAKLGQKLVAVATSPELAQEYIGHGAEEVLVLPALAADQPVESYVPVIADAVKAEAPEVFLVGGTSRGKEMGSRIAARLGIGLCSGCTGFKVDGGKLLMDRMVYGGTGIQTVACTTTPQMATIPPRTFEKAAPKAGAAGTTKDLPAAAAVPVKVLGRFPKEQQAVDITEAKVVVCVGRGVEKQEDLAMVRELAKAVGGEVGCSRPVAEELRWFPEDLYLGISGKKVKPPLYIGVGVSGQIQHVSGIRDSKVIFAINKDESAPIFEAADYGIVGDLYKVVPKLIEELKAAKN
jgi:electron transfer flavoprotein alpha subunit